MSLLQNSHLIILPWIQFMIIWRFIKSYVCCKLLKFCQHNPFHCFMLQNPLIFQKSERWVLLPSRFILSQQYFCLAPWVSLEFLWWMMAREEGEHPFDCSTELGHRPRSMQVREQQRLRQIRAKKYRHWVSFLETLNNGKTLGNLYSLRFSSRFLNLGEVFVFFLSYTWQIIHCSHLISVPLSNKNLKCKSEAKRS